MSWSLGVAGTVHLDNITTPHGTTADQQGGSMVYFALAASPYSQVTCAGITGADAEASMRAALRGLPADLSAVRVSQRPTLRWTATHDFTRWVAVDEHEDDGCDEEWDAELSPALRAAQVLFVGSMLPQHQRRVIEQSSARLIGLDTMTVHIGRDRDRLQHLLDSTDLLFLNRTELAALAGTSPDEWEEVAHGLLGRGRLRGLVVKAGPKGAAVVTARGTVARGAHEVDPVMDPTGAGDALAGGFLGACAAAERDDDEFFAGIALEAGLRAESHAIRTFGTAGLREVGMARVAS